MKFRRLEQWEHSRTKALYETVFPEDRGAFADYYYRWKTKDNIIYAAEDEDGIHAMVHLNPFEVSVYGSVRTLHYIVAVATEKEYRHRGLMRNLLNLSMRALEENGEPFTFLMPASEAIYLPFGFRFAGRQRQGTLRAAESSWVRQRQGMLRTVESSRVRQRQGTSRVVESSEVRQRQGTLQTAESSGNRRETLECRPVRPEEYQALAGQADIFIWRDSFYYERLVQEQRCQNGDVMVVFADKKPVGTFCTSKEEPEGGGETAERPEACPFEIREVIAAEGFQDPVFEALRGFAGRSGDCRVYGSPDNLELAAAEEVPLLMMKNLSPAPAHSPEPVIFINEVV